MRLLLAFAVLAACAHAPAPVPSFSELIAPPIAHVDPAGTTWYELGPEAFALARQRGVPVLVDATAAWCHWCHVMDEVTYDDEPVASLLQAGFVTIRVDIDARPDARARYQHIGWPATEILSPEGETLYALTGFWSPAYFLPLLQKSIAGEGDPEAADFKARTAPAVVDAGELDRVRAWAEGELAEYYDPMFGGWGYMQKAAIEGAVELALATGEADPALHTLAAQEALIDPVWGGIWQYSEGRSWQTPHYERLARYQRFAWKEYALAYAATGDERWLADARAMRSFATRFLRDASGGFHPSMDADPPGAATEIDSPAYYASTDVERLAVGIPAVAAQVQADATGWLAEAALVEYAATGDGVPLALAGDALQFALEHLRDSDGAYRHTPDDASPRRFLADQVAMAGALVRMHEATGEARWLEAALETARWMTSRLEATDGGFYAQSSGATFAERDKPFRDNADAARLLIRLSALTGHDGWRASAAGALGAFAHEEVLARRGRSTAPWILGVRELAAVPAAVVLVGGLEANAELRAAALQAYVPGLAIKTQQREGAYPLPGPGQPRAFLCSGSSCSPPITYGVELTERLSELTPRVGPSRTAQSPSSP